MAKLPLGKTVDYPAEHAPGVLFPVAREDAREVLGLADPLAARPEGAVLWDVADPWP